MICRTLSLACLTAALVGAELPTWHALPAETVVVVNAPSGQAFLKQLEATRLGALITAEERLEGFFEMARGDDPAAAARVDELLAELELDAGQLSKFLAGQAGMGMVLVNTDDDGAQPVVIAWLEPEGDLAERLRRLIDVQLEMQDGPEDQRTVRFDQPLGEFDVTVLVTPQLVSSYQYNEATDDFVETTEVGEPAHVMYLQHGGRLLMARAESEVPLTVLEETFGGFLQNLSGDGTGGVAEKVLSDAALQAALPDGEPAIECYLNLSPIWTMLAIEDPAEADNITAMGFDSVGCGALVMSLEGDVLQANGFMAAPAPRTGIPAMFDLPQLDAVPAGWAPGDINEYTHMGLDLPMLYSQIKQLVIAIEGPQANNQFQAMEAGAMGFIGTDLNTLLAAFGNQLSFVGYKIDTPVTDLEADVVQSSAWTLSVVDEAVVRGALNAVGTMLMAQGGGMFAPVDEQGFTGFRTMGNPDMGMPEMGIYLGAGHLLFAMGEGVSTEAMNSLSSPPDVSTNLANSEAVARAHELLPPQASILWGIQDAGKQLGQLMDAMRNFVEMASFDSQGNEAAMVFNLLPEREEIENAFGVSTSQVRMTDGGLVLETRLELPAQ